MFEQLANYITLSIDSQYFYLPLLPLVNVMGDTVVAALVAHDIEDDIEFAGDGKAGDLVKPAPEEPVVGMEKTERATNTYKIEDHDEGAEDVKKSTLSA